MDIPNRYLLMRRGDCRLVGRPEIFGGSVEPRQVPHRRLVDGAGVAMQYAIDHSSDLLSMTLMSPLSPYGFGGTKDAQGTPVYPDFAGSGGGTVNPEFLRLLAAEDRTDSSPATALSTMNAFYFKPPFRVSEEREQMYVTSMLSTRLGDDHYPGDMTTSPNWPTVAPGTRGSTIPWRPTIAI